MQTELHSFDGTENCSGDLMRPDRYRHLFGTLQKSDTCIPRGAGLSYCAASAGENVRSVSCLPFNRILDFDPESGQIEVEPGLRLGELYRFITPRGWSMPILPGHPSITVGGCVGCNVHGKNHYRDGSFINVVERLTLFHPDHGELDCSRQKHPELFELTVGGFGLTGFVTSVRLRLRPLHGTAVRVKRQPVSSLQESAALLEQNHTADLLYSWHDFNARGPHFGRGFLYRGESVDDPQIANSTRPGDIRYRVLKSESRGNWPMGPLAPWLTRTAARVYGLTQRFSAEDKTYDLATASFPINGKEVYFWLFGRNGFREYQVLIPKTAWNDVAEQIRQRIAARNVSIGLASLKLFRSQGRLLRFDGEGICLAMDAPAGPKTAALFADLDRITEQAGGLVNLSKDSRLDAALVSRLFPGYHAFREGVQKFDPKRRFNSALRRRLDV